MNKQYKFVVEPLKIRLDKFLSSNMEGVSRGQIQKHIEQGLVTVNGEQVLESKQVVRINDKVVYNFQTKQESLPKNIPIKTLYNNHGLLIIDKPPGIAVHPGSGFTGDSLTQGLLYHFKDIKIVGEEDRPGIVHRLDKDTSGVMLVALKPDMYDYLKKAFAEHTIKKEYIALVRGNLESPHGIINTPIGKSKTDFRKISTSNVIKAKEALTEYWVIEHLGGTGSYLDEYTLIKVQLHTGRTHQIRVHFSSLGYPVLGDSLYGTKKNGVKGLERQFLHASSIEVKLPNGETVEVKSKLPEDLREVLAKLGSKKLKSL